MDQEHVAELKPENQQQVQTFIEDVLRRSGLPGISVAMDVNGATLEAAAGVSDMQLRHPMSSEMRFELGCINKFLTSLIALDCASNGLLDLDRAVSSYLPDLAGANGDRIRVRHLLSHTAGYQGENLTDPDVAQDYGYEDFARGFNTRPLLFEPGRLFDYSHSAAVLIGRIVETVTEKKTSDLIRARIFRPLDIKALGAEHASSSRCTRGHQLDLASGQLHQPFPIEWCPFWSDSLGGPWLTMRELVRIGRAIVMASEVISKPVRELLLPPVVTLPGLVVGSKAEQPFPVFGHGCARYPNGSHGARSTSIGQCCALRFDLRTGIAIAVALNAEAPYLRDLVIDKLFNAMLPEDAPVIPALCPPPETGFTLEDLVGCYQGAKGHGFELIREGEQLVLRAGHNPAVDVDARAPLLCLTLDERGGLKLPEPAQRIALGFVRDKETERCHLMVGGNVFVHRPAWDA